MARWAQPRDTCSEPSTVASLQGDQRDGQLAKGTQRYSLLRQVCIMADANAAAGTGFEAGALMLHPDDGAEAGSTGGTQKAQQLLQQVLDTAPQLDY